jgi:hypothetical protein
MKLKKLLVTICAVAIAMSSFAQLSTRIDDPSTFKFGTRPVAGDLGLNLQLYAAGASNFKSYFQDMPIINMQYYLDSDMALRFGIRAAKHKTIFKGETDTVGGKDDGYTSINGTAFNLKTLKLKTSTREYMIYLGLEKHYSPTNLLDVYWGGQIPFGFSSDVTQENIDYTSTYTDSRKRYLTQRTNSIIYGVEFFLGLQAFIADLPIAVGVEWGYAGYGKLRNKTYTKIEQTEYPQSLEFYSGDVGVNPSQVTSNSGLQFTKLNSRKFDMDNMIRFRLSYYFVK